MKIKKTKLQSKLDELWDEVEDIEPLATLPNGARVFTFADAAVVNSLNAASNVPDIGTQTRNEDGTIASTGKMVHAINPDYFFANRVKKGRGKLYVVSGHTPEGFRCIQEQAKGKVPFKLISVYVLSRDDNGELRVEAMTSVSDDDFVKDYTSSLDNAVMAEILPLITKFDGGVNKLDSMPI